MIFPFPQNLIFYLFGVAFLIGMRFFIGIISNRRLDRIFAVLIYALTTLPFIVSVNYSSLSVLLIFEVLDALLLNVLAVSCLLTYAVVLASYTWLKPAVAGWLKGRNTVSSRVRNEQGDDTRVREVERSILRTYLKIEQDDLYKNRSEKP